MPPETPEALNAELLARIVELEQEIVELQAELPATVPAVPPQPCQRSRSTLATLR